MGAWGLASYILHFLLSTPSSFTPNSHSLIPMPGSNTYSPNISYHTLLFIYRTRGGYGFELV